MTECMNPLKIKPYFFIHLLDKNDNIERLVVGPKTVVLQEHEELIGGIQSMIKLTVNEYCVIENPTIKNNQGEVVFDSHGMAILQHGEFEYRFYQEPFPLYPGESLSHVKKMENIDFNCGLILEVLADFEEEGMKRTSGELILVRGPKLYRPRKELKKVIGVSAQMIVPNTALKMKAIKNCVDSAGQKRNYGEEWLVKTPGAYLPSPYEEVVGPVEAIPITENTALHMKSLRTHTDEFGRVRKHGAEYLITCKETHSHIPNVNEELLNVQNAIVLNKLQYCVILNPVDENLVPKFGFRKLVKGETIFFLHPEESLERGIEDVYILGSDEALLVKANEPFEDKVSGERWMINGPLEYIPPIEVEICERRRAIPLDSHEGIYVRNLKTGNVRSVIGQTYILTEEEELWDKEIPEEIVSLLGGAQGFNSMVSPVPGQIPYTVRPKSRVVSFRVPHNSAVQIYDFKARKARVIFGPDYVMLGPDEQFTRLSLSGGKPKEPNRIKSLNLLLGPDFSTDIVIVETADHARLSLKLSYNWHFEVHNKNDQTEAAKLFAVPDFIGDMCKAIASRVRGVVAAIPFDEFHKNSSRLIRKSLFGLDENGKVRDSFVFPQNNMKVTNIDVQSVEPVDQRTKDSLQKSVQLAIEITTNSQEASARREGERLEQEARGRLDRQKLIDQATIEKTRQQVIELQVESTSLEACGQARAEAESKRVAASIDGESAILLTELKSKAADIDAEHELERMTEAREEELVYLKSTIEHEIYKQTRFDHIEEFKFDKMIESITPATLTAIAAGGGQNDIQMLQALGLKSTLITDGSSPINLLQTANGLIGHSMGIKSQEC